MKPRNLPNDRIDRKFSGTVRHYHRKSSEQSWDDWTGSKKKSAKREQIDRIILRTSVLLVGALLLVGILALLYVVMKVILGRSS